MIELSVRCAVPLLFVAFAASSVNVLFPGLFGRWILRNRKFIGLSFAAAMAWQLFFILWMVTQYTEYYVERSLCAERCDRGCRRLSSAHHDGAHFFQIRPQPLVHQTVEVLAQGWDLLAVDIRLDRLLVAHLLLQQSHCSGLYLLLGGFPCLGPEDGSVD